MKKMNEKDKKSIITAIIIVVVMFGSIAFIKFAIEQYQEQKKMDDFLNTIEKNAKKIKKNDYSIALQSGKYKNYVITDVTSFYKEHIWVELTKYNKKDDVMGKSFWVFASDDGEVILEGYKPISYYCNGYVIGSKNKKRYLFDKTGKVIYSTGQKINFEGKELVIESINSIYDNNTAVFKLATDDYEHTQDDYLVNLSSGKVEKYDNLGEETFGCPLEDGDNEDISDGYGYNNSNGYVAITKNGEKASTPVKGEGILFDKENKRVLAKLSDGYYILDIDGKKTKVNLSKKIIKNYLSEYRYEPELDGDVVSWKDYRDDYFGVRNTTAWLIYNINGKQVKIHD